MIHYKDMTFCTEKTCKHFGVDCERSLTEDVLARARRWWGDDGEPPISVFLEKPKCYEGKDNE